MRKPHPTPAARRARRLLAGALLALAPLLGSAVLAAPNGAMAGMAGKHPALAACQADAQKLCPQARPGDGQLLGCLQSHADALTPACRDALPALGACREAAQRLCGDAAAGQRRSCLAKHRAELAQCGAAAH